MRMIVKFEPGKAQEADTIAVDQPKVSDRNKSDVNAGAG
jgi:hypothetical protein